MITANKSNIILTMNVSKGHTNSATGCSEGRTGISLNLKFLLPFPGEGTKIDEKGTSLCLQSSIYNFKQYKLPFFSPGF